MSFSLNPETLQSASDWLAKQDKTLAMVVEKYGYPPLWARAPNFANLVHIILEQQVSLESAKAAFLRLQAFIGDISPSNFQVITDEELLSIGFSRQKKRYVRDLSDAILQNDFNLEALSELSDQLVRTEMKRIKGIGDWTADIYLTFCLLRPDILPKGDIALYESIKALKNLEKRPDYTEFLSLTEHWRPWRSVGSRLLWHFYLCERGRGTITS